MTTQTGRPVMIGASAPHEREDKKNVRCPALGERPCQRPGCSGARCERWIAKDQGIAFVEDEVQIVVLSADELAELRKWGKMRADKLPEALAAMVRSFVAAEKDALESRVDPTFREWKRFGEQLQQRVIDLEAREQSLTAEVASLKTQAAPLETRASPRGELNHLEGWKKLRR